MEGLTEVLVLKVGKASSLHVPNERNLAKGADLKVRDSSALLSVSQLADKWQVAEETNLSPLDVSERPFWVVAEVD